jgi:hypothetical protein
MPGHLLERYLAIHLPYTRQAVVEIIPPLRTDVDVVRVKCRPEGSVTHEGA